MQDYRLITVSDPVNPVIKYNLCDLNNGADFLDPLILHSLNRPDLRNADENLYGIGGEVTPDTMEKAYKYGIFPWFAYKLNSEVEWFCPEERYVIFPERIHVGHSLRNLINKKKYTVTVNKAFSRVIFNCRHVNDRDDSSYAWLSDDIENSFLELYNRGYAKSVEVWEGDELVGGFYGFFYKGIFEGDSMFSFRPSASQVGLVHLCRNPYIEGEKIKCIDTQFETPTFKRLGGDYISYEKYREIMDK